MSCTEEDLAVLGRQVIAHYGDVFNQGFHQETLANLGALMGCAE